MTGYYKETEAEEQIRRSPEAARIYDELKATEAGLAVMRALRQNLPIGPDEDPSTLAECDVTNGPHDWVESEDGRWCIACGATPDGGNIRSEAEAKRSHETVSVVRCGEPAAGNQRVTTAAIEIADPPWLGEAAKAAYNARYPEGYSPWEAIPAKSREHWCDAARAVLAFAAWPQ